MDQNADEALKERFAHLNIREQDLDEQFVRSGGKGGQNVNKVSTCVIITHKPTGLIVRCEEERSQSRNRTLARKRLADRIEAAIKKEKLRQRQENEKLRRKNRPRSRNSKNRMLEIKKRRSETKKLRKRPRFEE